MTRWLQYLIAFVVLCHGFIYVRIGPVVFGSVKEWNGRSWLLGGAVTDAWLKTLVVTLHVIAGIFTLVCAIAVAFAPSLPGWWPPLAMGSGVVGLAAFAVFWDGQTRLLVEEGAIGAVISLILIVSAAVIPGALE